MVYGRYCIMLFAFALHLQELCRYETSYYKVEQFYVHQYTNEHALSIFMFEPSDSGANVKSPVMRCD